MTTNNRIEDPENMDEDPRLDEEMEFTTFYDYLQSPEGHEIASRIVEIVEDAKKATLDKHYTHSKFNRWIDALFIIIVITAIITLSIMNKLNPTIAVFLGSVIGYFFGKSK